jgi:hypothetical protein
MKAQGIKMRFAQLKLQNIPGTTYHIQSIKNLMGYRRELDIWDFLNVFYTFTDTASVSLPLSSKVIHTFRFSVEFGISFLLLYYCRIEGYTRFPIDQSGQSTHTQNMCLLICLPSFST